MSTAAAADSSFIKCSIKEFKSQNGRVTAPEETFQASSSALQCQII